MESRAISAYSLFLFRFIVREKNNNAANHNTKCSQNDF